MNPDEFFQLGKVVKTSGSAGDLVFFLDTEQPSGYKKLESVFIQLQGNLIPFFIDRIELKTHNQALVKLLDVNSINDATPLLGAFIFLPNSLQPKKRQRKSPEFDLTGFKVIDSIHGEIGTVVSILEMPMQEILEIDFNGREVLIPLVEEIVKEIDSKGKIITIEAPEGLIEIYL